jgi:hypothetical protein
VKADECAIEATPGSLRTILLRKLDFRSRQRSECPKDEHNLSYLYSQSSLIDKTKRSNEGNIIKLSTIIMDSYYLVIQIVLHHYWVECGVPFDPQIACRKLKYTRKTFGPVDV